MLLFVEAALSIFVVLKLGQLLTRNRQADAMSTRRKWTRELIRVVVSLALGASIAIYHDWWIHRLASREYAHSRVCYPQIETALNLRGIPVKVDVLTLEHGAEVQRSVAEEHGLMLGMSRQAVAEDLAGQRVAFLARYTELVTKRDRRQLSTLADDVTRCLNDDWAPHGEIFNP